VPPSPRFLLDTGPLVAFFNPRDPDHAWALRAFDAVEPPLVTCEPVLTEAFHLLMRHEPGLDLLAAYCQSGVLQVDFRFLDHAQSVHYLMLKYRNLPMDLADACLVLLAEQNPLATIITTDRDFLIYRTRNRRQLRLLAPFCN
jgi:uncharacterized protein